MAQPHVGSLQHTQLPVPCRVRDAEQSRYSAVLVDEFQDTNALQWRLVQLLAERAGGGSSLFVVGDVNQVGS